MMPYNKPYYGQLIENYGFEKSQDMYAFWGHMGMLAEASERLQFVIEQAKERFDEEGISIPFPQRDVKIKPNE